MTPGETAVDPELGLTAEQVEDRITSGRVNVIPTPPSRSIRQIVRANVVTPVNMIMITLLVLILISGNPGDSLFGFVILSNSIIGILQELRAKRNP